MSLRCYDESAPHISIKIYDGFKTLTLLMFFKYKKLNYFQTKESSLNYKTVKAAGRSDRLYGHFASTSTTHAGSETIIKNNIFVGLYSYTIVFLVVSLA